MTESMMDAEGGGVTTANRTRLTGDADQFSAALSSVASDAMRLARSLGCRPDEAADVVQEAACAAWRYRDSCHTNFRAWFLTIVRRKSATRPRRWVTLPLSWRDPAIDGVDALRGAGSLPEFARIPRRQRAALWLRYGVDLPISEVASVLGISESATKQLLFMARTNLGKELARSNQEETR